MHILGLSGSLRTASTNTALLRGLAVAAEPPVTVTLFDDLASLPPFSPDHEGPLTPEPVLGFAQKVETADGLVIACPEYVHALPGAFKNALDWLVSRPEIIAKPVALVHASHRGDDMLTDLRRVMATVTDRFAPDIFLRLVLNRKSPDEIAAHLAQNEQTLLLRGFINQFTTHIRASRTDQRP